LLGEPAYFGRWTPKWRRMDEGDISPALGALKNDFSSCSSCSLLKVVEISVQGDTARPKAIDLPIALTKISPDEQIANPTFQVFSLTGTNAIVILLGFALSGPGG